MSEAYLRTRSLTCMHLNKFKVFSSLRRPETHFRHAQGHQRASALTGSNNIFQSTTITVYEVENQKTVNTKLGKQTIWFSDFIENIYHYFQEKQAGRRKRQKRNLHCFPKAYQSILQTHMAKKYNHFWRTDQNTPQTKHRKKMSSKKTTIEQFLQNSVHTDMKSTREAISQQKTPKTIHSWSNHFWNPIANVSVKEQYEETSIENWNTAEKNWFK